MGGVSRLVTWGIVSKTADGLLAKNPEEALGILTNWNVLVEFNKLGRLPTKIAGHREDDVPGFASKPAAGTDDDEHRELQNSGRHAGRSLFGSSAWQSRAGVSLGGLQQSAGTSGDFPHGQAVSGSSGRHGGGLFSRPNRAAGLSSSGGPGLGASAPGSLREASSFKAQGRGASSTGLGLAPSTLTSSSVRPAP